MNINYIKYPSESQWDKILRRPVTDLSLLQETVCAILDDVKSRGDKAIKEYGFKFDHAELTQLQVTEKEITDAEKLIPFKLKEAILVAKANIEKFHTAQQTEFPRVETTPGVVCWQKGVAIEKV